MRVKTSVLLVLVATMIAFLPVNDSRAARHRSNSGKSKSTLSHSARHGRTVATVHSSSAHHSSTYTKHVRCQTCPRDSHGHIKRSLQAKHEFRKTHPCPSTGKTHGPCPGYVIDHIRALKRGGADSPGNMQWQTKEAAKQKDKIE